MAFSTRGRYGLRAMLELAVRHDRRILVEEICRLQQVPKKYVQGILFSLKKAGLVESRRGVGGGYVLSRPPSRIRLLEVFEALEGPFYPASCLDGRSRCQLVSRCVLRPVWAKTKRAVDGVLGSLTLQQLAVRQKRKRQ